MTDDDKALVERLQRSAEYWDAEAKRYAANQEYWRMEERAAIVAWLRSILEQWLETAREHLDTEVAGRTFEALERMK